MGAGTNQSLPIWVLVMLCGLATQFFKLMVYSALQRRWALRVLGESVGLPSLHAAVLTCLTVSLALRLGWRATETAFAVVFTVLVVHDAIRVKGASQQQRVVLNHLLKTMPPQSRFQKQMAVLINDRSHQPLHVAFGALFGLLFALVSHWLGG